MYILGLSLENVAAETSRITGKSLMRVKRWFYRKISQTRRSGSAPPKYNSPASDKKPFMPQSHKALPGPYLAADAGLDVSIHNSRDRNKEGHSDLARPGQVTPPGDSFDLLIPSKRRFKVADATWSHRPGHGSEGCKAPQVLDNLDLNLSLLSTHNMTETHHLDLNLSLLSTHNMTETHQAGNAEGKKLDLNAHPAPN